MKTFKFPNILLLYCFRTYWRTVYGNVLKQPPCVWEKKAIHVCFLMSFTLPYARKRLTWRDYVADQHCRLLSWKWEDEISKSNISFFSVPLFFLFLLCCCKQFYWNINRNFYYVTHIETTRTWDTRDSRYTTMAWLPFMNEHTLLSPANNHIFIKEKKRKKKKREPIKLQNRGNFQKIWAYNPYLIFLQALTCKNLMATCQWNVGACTTMVKLYNKFATKLRNQIHTQQ